MAQKVIRELIDDLDDSPVAATVQFGYDGRDYEIELTEEHAAELDKFLAPYLEHARRLGGGGRAGRRRRLPRQSRQPRQDTQAICVWVWDHGYRVSDRGRLPTNVVAAYRPSMVKLADRALLARKRQVSALLSANVLLPLQPAHCDDIAWQAVADKGTASGRIHRR